jgi:hypothetical protein
LSDDPEKGSQTEEISNDDNILKLHYDIKCHEAGIDRLISEGRAFYQCIIECPATYYLLHKEFQEASFNVEIPLDKVYKRCTVKIVIVACQDIVGCDFLNLDKDYEDAVDFPKGAVLANIDDFTILLQQSNSAADLSRIVCVMFSETPTVRFDYSGKRIIIKVPTSYETRYNRVEDLCPGVVEASLVYTALVQAIYKLRESPETSRDWVFYLTQYLKELNEEGTITLRDDNLELELEDIYVVVDKLLSNPMLRAIDDTTKQLQ